MHSLAVQSAEQTLLDYFDAAYLITVKTKMVSILTCSNTNTRIHCFFTLPPCHAQPEFVVFFFKPNFLRKKNKRNYNAIYPKNNEHILYEGYEIKATT